MIESVFLKPKKEIPLLRRHPWIFSGAVASLPAFENGSILPVHSSHGKKLGWGIFNKNSNIIGRMVSFDQDADPDSLIINSLERALEFRSKWSQKNTTAYRLVNGEGDALPGLIIDKYDNYLVIQINTLGIEKQRSQIIEKLIQIYHPLGIYEKSAGSSRRHEGLEDRVGVVYGVIPSLVQIVENDINFFVDILEGQKTGFFIDQRPMRQRVRELSLKKRILNCFCYTGGFSAYALTGGASFIESVDSSEKAIALTEKNLVLNMLDSNKPWTNHTQDVFAFLNETSFDYDLIILDPPAFAKKQQDLKNAYKGYKNLNKIVLKNAKKNTLLLTCSCSQPISEECFQKIIFEASLEAGRDVQILEKQRLAWDHPTSLYHPEGSYLKGFLLQIN